jgi:single-strand DNA-binding protein
MTEQTQADTVPTSDTGPSNTVRLRGRVSSAPLERGLPSGDTILTFRLVVARDPTPMTTRSRQRSDWVDCVVWAGRARRGIARWRVGDTVEVEGALRRRFFRSGTGAVSRVEVEVLAGRVLERAG